MSWIELEAPTAAPVDLEELKGHLRVTTNNEDATIELYAKAAGQLFEIKTNRRLISRSFRLDLPAFPASADPCGIELPFAPAEEITHIKYFDTAGVLQTWDDEEYIMDLTSHFPRVTVAPNYLFPSTQTGRPNAVQVTFVAGYGDTYEDIPEGIRLGVFFLAAHAYTTRTPVVNGTMTDVPKTLQYVIDAYKLWRA
jgi:uncharacterized phiE125 gp8 family phage protein